jgi:hypothetical protein
MTKNITEDKKLFIIGQQSAEGKLEWDKSCLPESCYPLPTEEILVFANKVSFDLGRFKNSHKNRISANY